MLSYKDKIITFPLFNSCYPQNLARNLARFVNVKVDTANYRLVFGVLCVTIFGIE